MKKMKNNLFLFAVIFFYCMFLNKTYAYQIKNTSTSQLIVKILNSYPEDIEALMAKIARKTSFPEIDLDIEGNIEKYEKIVSRHILLPHQKITLPLTLKKTFSSGHVKCFYPYILIINKRMTGKTKKDLFNFIPILLKIIHNNTLIEVYNAPKIEENTHQTYNDIEIHCKKRKHRPNFSRKKICSDRSEQDLFNDDFKNWVDHRLEFEKFIIKK